MSVHADKILINARVITCDFRRPEAGAVAVKKEKIMLAGGNSEIWQMKGQDTVVIDCEGKTLVPGFNDAHCHFFALIRKFLSLDLSPAAVHSIKEIRQRLLRKAQCTPAGGWISGTDYNEFYLEEKRHPTCRDLDEATPRHPVILVHRTMHACVLNSLGLELAGITLETEEPPGGLMERDLDSGKPNGLFFNMTGYIQERIKHTISREETVQAARQADEQYLSLGITSLGEATVTNDLKRWQAFGRLKEEGIIKSRIDFMPGFAAMEEFMESGLSTGAGDDSLHVGGLKIVLNADGGQFQPSCDELSDMVLDAGRKGFPVAIHAVEQDAVETAVDALEYARSRLPRLPVRQRIEHCSECPPLLRQRLGRLKAAVVSQPPFLYYSGERYLDQVSPQTMEWLYPFKSMMDEGLIVAGSSDSPIADNNPLTGIYSAVTRRSEQGQVLNISEAVRPEQALEMYTLNAALASSREKTTGSISPGKLADMVLLNGDPLNTPPEGLKDIKVEMTLIGGEVVWEK
ncbi:MAG: amidohydrolase [Dehalococcoidales bacterium]|nr:amidohydrolase [Dehalococcoidales bacterium]